ncbi:hypothetical protein KL86PLE_100527 [uncultured Pleomorphomonas sp.]|uniref:Uncharacterized protein n=1 Tax=uncultured Pleomorphomonas sp. TaxID=442121 RepID=A0A212L3W9_9HYPH|nr:hypothetical protein KL86PLE_100527 [uncultured Pleomorphomonas sp.]
MGRLMYNRSRYFYRLHDREHRGDKYSYADLHQAIHQNRGPQQNGREQALRLHDIQLQCAQYDQLRPMNALCQNTAGQEVRRVLPMEPCSDSHQPFAAQQAQRPSCLK